MSVQRFTCVPVTDESLARYVPLGATVKGSGAFFLDIDLADDQDLEALQEYLGSLGAQFVGTDPTLPVTTVPGLGLPMDSLYGAHATWLSVSTAQVEPGRVRSSDDSFDIVWNGALALNIAATGPGGRNVESAEAGDTWYAVFVIADSTGIAPTAAMLVKQADLGSWALPAGYNELRRLPYWFRNDAGSDLINVTALAGQGGERTSVYDDVALATTEVLTAGASNVPADINCSAFVPPSSRQALLFGNATDAVGLLLAELRPKGSASFRVALQTQVAAVLSWFQPTALRVDANRFAEYQVSAGALTVYVWGYVDQLD